MNSSTSRPDQPAFDHESSVSINNHYLSYESSGSGFAVGRQAGPAITRRTVAMAAAVAVIMTLVAAAAIAGSLRAVGAAEPEVEIASVHFDLEPGEGEPSSTLSASSLSASGPASIVRYRSLVVDYRGSAIDIEPLTGTVQVNLSQEQAQDMAADLDGLRVGSAAPDFADSLADAVSSTDVHRFVRFTPTDDGSPIAIDVSYSRPLGTDDFLLVQERLGDAVLELTAVDAAGMAIGTTVVVGPVYRWNTGHGSPPTEAAWASVVSIDRFATGGAAVSAIRIVGREAEFKVLALGSTAPQVAGKVAPPAVEVVNPVDDGVTADQEATAEVADVPEPVETTEAAETPPFAAVGIEAAVQPAIAVDGAGCETAPKVGSVAASSDAAVGQAATYCFTVTNLGTTHLTDVAISDPELGLSNAKLPQHSGQRVLEPGKQAVFYHHGVVAEPAGRFAIVTATPTEANGTPIDGFAIPAAATGSDLPAAHDAAAATDEPTGSDAPTVLANVVEEPAQTAAANEPAIEAPNAAVTELALTGMVTEPWVLVIFAMALIFIGYTAFVAFTERDNDREKGHDQLDALGFD